MVILSTGSSPIIILHGCSSLEIEALTNRISSTGPGVGLVLIVLKLSSYNSVRRIVVMINADNWRIAILQIRRYMQLIERNIYLVTNTKNDIT